MTGLRRAAIAEALTLLALVGFAVPLKYSFGVPIAVSIVGPIHGLAFIVFFSFAIRSWAEELINANRVSRLIVGAFISMGGFINERWLRQPQTETGFQ